MAKEDYLSELLGGSSRKLDDLDQFQRTIALNDFWRQAAAPVRAAKFDTTTWSPGTSFGVSAGQSLLAGILNGLGQRNEAAQLASVAEVLPELYANPGSVALPAGVDAEAFGGLKLDAMMKQAGDQAAIKNQMALKNLSYDPKNESVKVMPGATNAIQELWGAANPDKIEAPAKSRFIEAVAKYGDESLARDAIKDEDTNLRKDKLIKASLDKSFQFIDSKFEQAKNLVGGQAAVAAITGIPTEKGDQLTGLKDSVVYQIDKIINREQNSDVRKRILSLAPQWYDSPATIDAKKQNLKDFISSLSTPTLEESVKPVNTAPSSSINEFIATAKAQGLSKEQAKALWLQQKGK